MKYAIAIGAAAMAGLALAGCNNPLASNPTAIATAEDICAAVAVEQASALKLNAAETTAVSAIVTDCATTSQGANLSSNALLVSFFANAVTLQNSGLLASLKLTALAPEQRKSVDKVQLDWNKAKAFGLVK